MDFENDYSQIYQELKKIPSFDNTAFNNLVNDTNKEVVLKILSRFCITLKESVARVEEGLLKNDAKIIWEACHKVSSSSELLGFKNFGQLSRSLNLIMKALSDVDSHKEEIQTYINNGHDLILQIEKIFPNSNEYL